MFTAMFIVGFLFVIGFTDVLKNASYSGFVPSVSSDKLTKSYIQCERDNLRLKKDLIRLKDELRARDNIIKKYKELLKDSKKSYEIENEMRLTYSFEDVLKSDNHEKFLKTPIEIFGKIVKKSCTEFDCVVLLKNSNHTVKLHINRGNYKYQYSKIDQFLEFTCDYESTFEYGNCR